MTWCGSYCAISIVWDKLKCEGEVDLFSAMRTVKMNRPQLISSMVSCCNNNIIMTSSLRRVALLAKAVVFVF
jgi:hypothetical protein